MDLIRVGEKILSVEKLNNIVRKILQLRASGSTQSEVAEQLGVDRSFISHLEGLGEVRKGVKVAIVAFPVANKHEIEKLALETGVDLVIALSQEEREKMVENASGADAFNEAINLISELVDYDLIIMFASDLRIQQAEKIFGPEKVIGISIGSSPIRKDVTVEVEKIKPLLKSLITSKKEVTFYEKGGKRKFRIFKKRSLRRG